MPEPESQEPAVGEFGEMSFEDSMRDAVSRTNAEAGVSLEEHLAPQEDQAADALAEADPEATDAQEDEIQRTVAEEAEPEVQSDPAEDRSLARIMQKENDLLEKQSKYDAAQEELAGLRSRLDSFEASQRNFESDPVAMIRSLAPDLDLKRLAEGLWYEHQGDKAPAKYLEQKAATRQNTELVDRIAKLEQGNTEKVQALQEQEVQRVRAEYQGSLQTFAQSVNAESHPFMASMQSKDPRFVSGALFNIAQNHAQRTGGQVLPNDKLADAFEKELAFYQMSAAPAQQEPTPQPQGASLRNSSQQVQPDRSVDDENSDEFLHAAAMAAARAATGL